MREIKRDRNNFETIKLPFHENSVGCSILLFASRVLYLFFSILKLQSLDSADKAITLSFLVYAFRMFISAVCSIFSYQAKITVTENREKLFPGGGTFAQDFSGSHILPNFPVRGRGI